MSEKRVLRRYTAEEKAKATARAVEIGYLLGIARNIQIQRELTAFADALYRRRLEATDLVVCRLQQERYAITGTVHARLDTYVSRPPTTSPHASRRGVRDYRRVTR